LVAKLLEKNSLKDEVLDVREIYKLIFVEEAFRMEKRTS
jgi:hypothetical protein